MIILEVQDYSKDFQKKIVDFGDTCNRIEDICILQKISSESLEYRDAYYNVPIVFGDNLSKEFIDYLANRFCKHGILFEREPSDVELASLSHFNTPSLIVSEIQVGKFDEFNQLDRALIRFILTADNSRFSIYDTVLWATINKDNIFCENNNIGTVAETSFLSLPYTILYNTQCRFSKIEDRFSESPHILFNSLLEVLAFGMLDVDTIKARVEELTNFLYDVTREQLNAMSADSYRFLNDDCCFLTRNEIESALEV